MTRSDNNKPTVIAIGVITFMRPQGLKNLIHSLNTLTFSENSVEPYIVVVDNDPGGSSREIVDSLKNEISLPIEYHIESRRGIPAARNKIIEVSSERAGFIAYIDDDEYAESDWLDKLISASKKFEAEIVTGPTVRVFEKDPPDWMVRAKFFDPQRYETGTFLHTAATGNLLLSTELFNDSKNRFDNSLSLTGGSDTEFTSRLAEQGHKIVWCDEAVNYEVIPASRMNTAWMLKRAYRVGNSHTITNLSKHPLHIAFFKSLKQALPLLAKGLFLLPVGIILGDHKYVPHMRKIYQGAGMIVSLFGFKYNEYKKIHGS